jgi:hypothetical protein
MTRKSLRAQPSLFPPPGSREGFNNGLCGLVGLYRHSRKTPTTGSISASKVSTSRKAMLGDVMSVVQSISTSYLHRSIGRCSEY